MTATSAGETFADLFESTSKTIKEGEVVRGKVLSIDEDNIQIDIGFKSEGMVPTWEFMEEDGTLLVNVGDEVEVLLEESEDNLGRIVLSKEKADRLLIWDEISRAYKADEPVEGTVIARVKGGLAVDIGVKAFLPGSQVDLRPVRNLEQVVNQKLKFKIIKFNKRRGNIVLSRRALLETERKMLRENTLATLAPGQIIDGVIKNLTDYGAFIDLGGIDGLLHVTDMSWGRVNHPSELFQVGESRFAAWVGTSTWSSARKSAPRNDRARVTRRGSSTIEWTRTSSSMAEPTRLGSSINATNSRRFASLLAKPRTISPRAEATVSSPAMKSRKSVSSSSSWFSERSPSNWASTSFDTRSSFGSARRCSSRSAK